ncbi:MAG: DNA polymerase III subunit gamma/tau [Bacteroidota bacterium]|nr:DNA polymerase III subunit gamma/tau [Bacteroidota bacterium]MXZ16654.1 DNA polymerase III subunit gamma/tau [Rhodothermaceae bacterium]
MTKSQYLVTARKYRPQRFGDLVAQVHVAQALINALRLERVAHAYLFTGPRGVGKTTAARILAKAINCTGNQNDEVEPCLKCPSCEDFETQRSLSIFEIDAASNNKVEDIRDLRENVRILPQGGRRKVYIIDEVHMLSNAAFNALLKTLEEPPPHVLFIFATTEPHKVLPTILSRCQRFDFRRIPTNEIVRHLTTICKSEEITADEDSLHLVANKGDGALRDALSVFDQAVALCGSNLNYSTLADALRVVDVDMYFEATRHITEQKTGAILSLAEQIISDGYDIREFLGGLAEHVRNLLITITLGENALVDISKNLRGRYTEAVKGFTETTLLRLLMVIDETQTRLPVSTSPRLAVELALTKMTHLGESVDLSEALEQIRRLEYAGRGSQLTHAPQAPAPLPIQPAPAPTDPQESKPADLPETQQAQRSGEPPASAALKGRPALEQPKKKPENHQPVEPSHASVKVHADLQESWKLVLKTMEQRSDVPAIRTLQNLIVLREHDQCLEIAVRDDMQLAITKNGNLKKALKQAMQSQPELANKRVVFIVKPDVFPSTELDLDAEFQELKARIPALKQLDDAFGLRPVNNPTP